jgi:anti-sigma-K factor RskA
MTGPDHMLYRDDAGAYLLGALGDEERRAYEVHLQLCPDCREEVERLRPAADAMPRSVEQLVPPPGLKTALMEEVARDARDRSTEPERPARRPRLRPRGGLLRPALVGLALVLGALAGFGVAQLTGEEETRTVAATVDKSRVPDARASLQVQGGGENGAILRVQGLPSLRGRRVYQVWVQRGKAFEPQPTFEVRPNGAGAVAVPDDVSDAKAILVTREPRGGSTAPSEKPILAVPL